MLCVSTCCEVIIASGGEKSLRPVALDERDLVLGVHYAADLRQFRAKFTRPFLAKRGDLPGVDGEQLFKILSVGERSRQVSAGGTGDRDFGGVNLEPDPPLADLDESLQVAGQSIA